MKRVRIGSVSAATMIKKGWVRGEAPGFWMEEQIPEGIYDSFVYDDTSDLTGHRYIFLRFLSLLSIIEHGTIYETTDCIRIKVKQ